MACGQTSANAVRDKLLDGDKKHSHYFCDQCREDITSERFNSTVEPDFDLCDGCMGSPEGQELNKVHHFERTGDAPALEGLGTKVETHGMGWFTAQMYKAALRTPQMEKARTRDLAVLSQCLLQSVPTLYNTCVGYDTCTSEAAILVAVASNTRVRPILCFAERSSDVLGQRRTCVIVRRNVSSQLNHAIFKQLPAAAASATTAFLQKKVQQPASTHERRRRRERKKQKKKGHQTARAPKRPVYATVDMFAVRGGRNQLPIAKLVRSIVSYGVHHGHAVVTKGLGYRSSKAAGGLTAVFEDKRANRRDATLGDLPPKWSAAAPPPVPHHHQSDEVLGCIQQRDQIVFHALNAKRMAKELCVDEPIAYQRTPNESPK